MKCVLSRALPRRPCTVCRMSLLNAYFTPPVPVTFACALLAGTTVPATCSSKFHFSSVLSQQPAHRNLTFPPHVHCTCCADPACVSWSCDISLEHLHVASVLRETLNCCKVEQRMVLLRVARLGLCPSSRLSPYLDRCNVFLKKMYMSG